MDLYYPRIQSDIPVVERVSPRTAPLKWISFTQVVLSDEFPEWEFETGSNEAVIDIFGGHCTVEIDAGSKDATFPEIGNREDVFSGLPTMVYVPKDSRVRLHAERKG